MATYLDAGARPGRVPRDLGVLPVEALRALVAAQTEPTKEGGRVLGIARFGDSFISRAAGRALFWRGGAARVQGARAARSRGRRVLHGARRQLVTPCTPFRADESKLS